MVVVSSRWGMRMIDVQLDLRASTRVVLVGNPKQLGVWVIQSDLLFHRLRWQVTDHQPLTMDSIEH